MSESADGSLIRELLRAGDSDNAFKHIYKLYFEWLHKVSVPITGDEDESKDIIQNVFVNVWLLRDRFSTTETVPFKYYLLQSVINGSIDYRERRKRLTEILQHQQPSSSGNELRPDTILETKALDHAIQEGVAGLPTRRRECYQLSRQEGLSYKQIARHLNISEKAVEQNISGALKELRDYIQRYLQGKQ